MNKKPITQALQDLIATLGDYLDDIEVYEDTRMKAAIQDITYFHHHPDAEWYFRNPIPGEFGYLPMYPDDRVFILKTDGVLRRYIATVEEEATIQLEGLIDEVIQHLRQEL